MRETERDKPRWLDHASEIEENSWIRNSSALGISIISSEILSIELYRILTMIVSFKTLDKFNMIQINVIQGNMDGVVCGDR